MKKILPLFLFLTLPIGLHAIDVPFRDRKQDGGAAGEWMMNHSVSAKNLGMGNAATALKGVTASYHNPAAILGHSYGEIDFLFAPLFSDGNSQAISFSQPLSRTRAIGLNVLNLTSGEAEKTDRLGESIGSFKEQNLGFLLTYGQRILRDRLSAGLNIKIIRQSLDGKTGNGYGSDFGLQSHWFQDQLTVGLAIQNWLAPSIKQGSSTDIFPRALKGGVSYELNFLGRELIMAGDATKVSGENGIDQLRWGAGLEITPFQATSIPVRVRLGMNHREYAFGLGVSKNLIGMDYAMTLHELDVLHRFGISIKYGLSASLTESQLEDRLQALEKKESELKYRERYISQEENQAEKKRELIEKRMSKKSELKNEMQLLYQEKKYAEVEKLAKNKDDIPLDSEIYAMIETSKAYVQIDKDNYKEAKNILEAANKKNPSNEQIQEMLKRITDILELTGGLE